eukprot:TRINITY_DN12314_c0_g1_i1.p1 TRINITY_DN12314_c0_g1~~TRINITY_DN12314_c0_g1_i1.p1  ORF type:complete len:503 (+),score=92.32 TRINITY_DN12314_c0_g1_i1:153-1661(+)
MSCLAATSAVGLNNSVLVLTPSNGPSITCAQGQSLSILRSSALRLGRPLQRSFNSSFSRGLVVQTLPILLREKRETNKLGHRLVISSEASTSSSAVTERENEKETPFLVGMEQDPPRCAVFDYGFQARFLRDQPTVPGNVVSLALQNFGREWRALRRNYLFVDLPPLEEKERTLLETAGAIALRGGVQVLRFVDNFLTAYDGLSEIKPSKAELGEEVDELRMKLEQLTLDNNKVWEREYARPPVEAPWWILGPYYALCLMLDVLYDGRPIQRFWFLETVARMPYFSYISMLHLYETLGWWQTGSDVRKVHFAEEWNEMHHLKIMESLGGNRYWIDRFFGQHAAIFYYWILNFMFLISPKVAYNFSELIESHAVDTYGEFVDANEELLKSLPPSPIAVGYYNGVDLYMFDEFQTSRPAESRRVTVNSLYDVFCNIRDDEGEHVKTMVACQQLDTLVLSPNKVRRMQVAADSALAISAPPEPTEESSSTPANGLTIIQDWLSKF